MLLKNIPNILLRRWSMKEKLLRIEVTLIHGYRVKPYWNLLSVRSKSSPIMSDRSLKNKNHQLSDRWQMY